MITTVNSGSSTHNIANAFNVSSTGISMSCSNQALFYSTSGSAKINAWNQVLIESGVGILPISTAHVIVNSLHKTKINSTTGFEVTSTAGGITFNALNNFEILTDVDIGANAVEQVLPLTNPRTLR